MNNWLSPFNFNFPGDIDNLFKPVSIPISDFLQRNTFFNPLVNIQETDTSYELSLDVPGVKKEDLTLSVDRNNLVVRGIRYSDFDSSAGAMYKVEKSYGEFERTFPFLTPLQEDNIKATLKDGTLRISVKKTENKPISKIDIE